MLQKVTLRFTEGGSSWQQSERHSAASERRREIPWLWLSTCLVHHLQPPPSATAPGWWPRPPPESHCCLWIIWHCQDNLHHQQAHPWQTLKSSLEKTFSIFGTFGSLWFWVWLLWRRLIISWNLFDTWDWYPTAQPYSIKLNSLGCKTTAKH